MRSARPRRLVWIDFQAPDLVTGVQIPTRASPRGSPTRSPIGHSFPVDRPGRGVSPPSNPTDRLVHVTAGGVAPDVDPLSPMRACARDYNHPPDFPTDGCEFLARDAVPDTSEFSQRPPPPSRGNRRFGTRGPGPSPKLPRCLSRTSHGDLSGIAEPRPGPSPPSTS